MKRKRPRVEESRTAALVRGAMLATIVLFVAAALHPEARVWGMSPWAFRGVAVPWILGAVLASLVWVIPRGMASRSRFVEESAAANQITAAGARSSSTARFALAAALLAAVSSMLFWVLRARYHFLGDGYQSLSILAADPPFVKGTAPLMRLVLPPLRLALGADAPAAALHAYQIVAIASGALFLVAAALFARATFERRLDAALFFALCATCGSMLLFFGYVENYAPFVALNAATCFAGVAALEGRISRAWILAPALPLFAAHAFGPLAAPAVAYVLLSHEGAARKSSAAGRRLRIGIGLVAAALVVAAGLAFAHLLRNDLKLQLAFLPLARTWYTADGVTLFSPRHFVDLANLAFQLVPGILLFGALFALGRAQVSPTPSVRTFFALLLVPQWLAVFVIDPTIGMPRDWDLFAFAGVPLVILCGLAALRSASSPAIGRTTVALAAALGLAALAPRVLEARSEPHAVARFRTMLDLDPGRSRTGRSILVKHYSRTDQDALAEAELDRYEALLPQREMLRQADEHHNAGRFDEAIRICREVLARDPGFNEAYMLLGEALLMVGDLENSRIMSERGWATGADASRCLNNMALANAWLGHDQLAEKYWRKALAAEPDSYVIHLSLAKLYETQGRTAEYREHLAIAARSEHAAPDVVQRARELGLVGP